MPEHPTQEKLRDLVAYSSHEASRLTDALFAVHAAGTLDTAREIARQPDHRAVGDGAAAGLSAC